MREQGPRFAGLRRVLLLLAVVFFLYGLVEIFLQAPAGDAKRSAAALVLLTAVVLALVGWLVGRVKRPDSHVER